MKKKIAVLLKSSLLTFLIAGLLSCSGPYNLYRQIATVSSNDVQLHDDGSFKYETVNYTISYDFWNEDGLCLFTILNKTNADIYFDLSNSHFIRNHHAYGYAENITYQINNTTSQNSSPNTYYQPAINNLQKTRDVPNNMSTMQTAVCIPSHCYKTFGKFNVANGTYDKCGFIKNPQENEEAKVSFNAENSPVNVTNKLTLIVNGNKETVLNSFYISEYENVPEFKMYETVEMKRCDGTPYKEKVCIRANNQNYYVSYHMDFPTYGAFDESGRTE